MGGRVVVKVDGWDCLRPSSNQKVLLYLYAIVLGQLKLQAQLRHLWCSLQATKPHCSGLVLVDIYKANTRGFMGVYGGWLHEELHSPEGSSGP